MSVPLVSDAPRVAIYARYSSDLQNPRSIDDQIHLCRRRLATDGLPRSRTYTDAARTGTHIHERAGLRALMADAFSGEIDLICAEALDRISRDLSDVASIWKRLQFHGTELLTVEEGKITTMHVALKGLLNDEFIRALAAKTRRGQAGRVREGRIPGGLSYGYRMVNRIEDNRMIRGLREIHAEQAAVVRTIYRLYAEGLSTRAIAAMLNGKRIPAPRGGQWSSVSINGNRARRNGILNNELYRGKITYNRQRFIRDPDTGKRVPRINPHTEWIMHQVPELRIVDDALWEKVQSRRRNGHDRRSRPGRHAPRPLSGVTVCGVCGGTMTIIARGRYGCLARREKGTCTNSHRIAVTDLETRATRQLLAIANGPRDWARLAQGLADRAKEREARLRRSIAAKRSAIARLLHAIETGGHASSSQQRIVEIERGIAAHDRELKDLVASSGPVPPDIRDRMATRLATLHDIAARPEHPKRHDAILALRPLIRRIKVYPGAKRGEVVVRVIPHPENLALMALRSAQPL